MPTQIPDPVIEAQIDWDITDDRQYSVDVMVGGVAVTTHEVARGWRPGAEYASDEAEAQQIALREFGNRLRLLLSGTA